MYFNLIPLLFKLSHYLKTVECIFDSNFVVCVSLLVFVLVLNSWYHTFVCDVLQEYVKDEGEIEKSVSCDTYSVMTNGDLDRQTFPSQCHKINGLFFLLPLNSAFH